MLTFFFKKKYILKYDIKNILFGFDVKECVICIIFTVYLKFLSHIV